jgi:hypothetical protein
MARGAWWKLVLAGAGALALSTGSAWAAQVGPGQVFTGVVNGSTSNATVDVVCPGPVGPNSVGRPFDDTWQVVEGTGAGLTGSAATEIVATIGPASGTTGASIFTQYGVPQAFPSTLLLPCSGTGLAVFRPQPTSPTARSSTVTVRFVNVAV